MMLPEGASAMTIDYQLPLPSSNNESIKELRRRLRLVMRAMDEALDKLGAIERDLKILEGLAPVSPGCIIGPRTGPIVYNLDVQKRYDDSIVVSINGGDPFILGPRLAGVFQFISAGGCSSDDLIGWRSREEILKSLNNFAGHELRIGYVNSLINLLKDKLAKAGYDRDLIQTSREKGVRLALKRRNARGVKGDYAPSPSILDAAM
jgi:hypothetical protein